MPDAINYATRAPLGWPYIFYVNFLCDQNKGETPPVTLPRSTVSGNVAAPV